MKNIFKFLFLGLVVSMIWSCEKDEDRAVTGTPTASTLTADKTSLVLIKEQADTDVVTFSFTNPSYGPNLAITNQLQFAKAGTNFVGAKNVDLDVAIHKLTYKGQAFNALMLNVGLPVNEASAIEVRLKSTVGNLDPVYSSVVKMTVTPYALISYLYAPGAYQGWNPSTANTLISATSNGEYETYIDFITAADNGLEFKVTAERNWDNGYGSDDNVHLILNGGQNLKATSVGSQKLSVNLNDKTFKLTPYSWGIIGSATPGGWDNDTDMFYNDADQTFIVNNVALTAGEIKFRLNNGWDTNYGGSNGNAVSGGDNIAVASAGNYKIVFDFKNLKYTITKL